MLWLIKAELQGLLLKQGTRIRVAGKCSSGKNESGALGFLLEKPEVLFLGLSLRKEYSRA